MDHQRTYTARNVNGEFFRQKRNDTRCEFGFTQRNENSRKDKHVNKYKRQFLNFQNLYDTVD